MGCCGSKHTDHDEAERSRLLNEDSNVHPYGTSRMVPVPYGEQNQVRELESLQRIVERTAGHPLPPSSAIGSSSCSLPSSTSSRTLDPCTTLNQKPKNLIDIPSTLQLERLQQQEAQNRSNEYISALNTVKLPQQTIKKLHSMTSVVKAGADVSNEYLDGGMKSTVSSAVNSIKAPSVREVLAEKTIDAKTLGWMASAMGELHQATEQIDVEDVGDLIVTLSPPVA